MSAEIHRERAGFVAEVGRSAQAEVDRYFSDTPEFVFSRAEATSTHGARVIVHFSPADEPDAKFAYWAYIWEVVAWDLMYVTPPDAPPIDPFQLAAGFVGDLGFVLDERDWREQASEPDTDGIRGIRKVVVWT